MNRREYRAAFDRIPFRADFQRDTLQKLREHTGQRTEKECYTMKKKRFALVAVALAALLMVPAAAAAVLLSPRDVAQHAGQQALAEAFEGEDAVTINERKSVGGYDVTLMGMVSGAGLSLLEEKHADADILQDRTYAVLSMTRQDGGGVAEDLPLTVSPLVEGFAPWMVNAWTLNGGVSAFTEGGVLYYLLECDNVSVFADHTVYLAVYPGTHIPPSADLFTFGEDGKIGIQTGREAALFVLPLDPALADPAAAAQFVF